MLPASDTPSKDSFDARVEELRNQGLFRRPLAPAARYGDPHVSGVVRRSGGVLAPPATATERLASKDKLTTKESAAWLDDWLTRLNTLDSPPTLR